MDGGLAVGIAVVGCVFYVGVAVRLSLALAQEHVVDDHVGRGLMSFLWPVWFGVALVLAPFYFLGQVGEWLVRRSE